MKINLPDELKNKMREVIRRADSIKTSGKEAHEKTIESFEEFRQVLQQYCELNNWNVYERYAEELRVGQNNIMKKKYNDAVMVIHSNLFMIVKEM